MRRTGWLYLSKKVSTRKGVLLLLFLLFFCKISFAQWNWIRSGDGAVENYALGLCNDKFGNVYITGGYQAPILTFGSYTLGHGGAVDVFLVKYDANGNVLWAKREGGTNVDHAYSITTDKQANVYVGGRFASNPISFGAFTLPYSGDNDFFLVKYDPNGNVLWARNGGGNNADPLFTVKTDSQDNVYITGYTTSTPLIIGSTTITGNPFGPYIVKYDKDGNFLWAKGASGNAASYALTLDSQDNVFITGGFSGPLVMDNYTVTNDVNAGGHFLIKLDNSGNVLWGKYANTDYGYGLSTNANGDVFITGVYSSPTVGIGSYTFSNANGGMFSDAFIAKYDKDGNVIWAKSISGLGNDFGHSVATDESNVYVTGGYSYSLSIGSYTLPASNDEPMYFARMNFDGNINFATSLKSGGGGSIQNGICVDNSGNAYVTGNFKTNPFYAGNYFVNQTGMRNIYLAKYHFTDVGIDEHKTENSKISIVPNPNDGHFTIQLKGPIVQEAEISIFDITGKEVLKQNRQVTGSCELNLENLLENGLYLVKIKLEDGTHEVHRLVISK